MTLPIFSSRQSLKRLLAFLLPIQRYRVIGESMLPALSPGSTVLVTTMFFHLHKGDIVALLHPQTNRMLIKRISRMTKDGIDVRGDNTDFSTDSRHFGLITRRHLIGKVFYFS